MTPNELIVYAYNGKYPNEPMNTPQMLLWQTSRVIALEWRNGMTTKPEATERKRQALMDYNYNLTEWQNGIDCAHRIADLYKRIELATSAYRLDKTIDNADKVLEAIYGL